jgi:hypothetical protein
MHRSRTSLLPSPDPSAAAVSGNLNEVVIPILVIACNRDINRTLDQLLGSVGVYTLCIIDAAALWL